MTYPTIDLVASRVVRDELFQFYKSKSKYPTKVYNRDFAGLESHVELVGEAHVDVESLYQTSETLRNKLIVSGAVDNWAKAAKKPSEDVRSEYLEELMAEELHKVLDSLPYEALHDANFWRYLGLFPFRWYLLEREPELKDVDFGGVGSKRQYWLLIRTYLWGRKCFNAKSTKPYEKVYATRNLRRRLKESDGWVIDFYHSHIIRPRWSDLPSVTGAFIEATDTSPELIDKDSNGPVRALAKSVARLQNNLCLPFLNENELAEVFCKEK
jgi:hypothetical protein